MSTYPIAACQHTKKNGLQCGSPALRNQQFCYYHQRQRPVIENSAGSAPFPPAPFFLPPLEDANSIQRALSKICGHLLNRRLDPKKAGVLLYAVQLASTNLRRADKNMGQKESSPLPPAR